MCINHFVKNVKTKKRSTMKGIFIYWTISCFSLYRYRQKIVARLPETDLDVVEILEISALPRLPTVALCYPLNNALLPILKYSLNFFTPFLIHTYTFYPVRFKIAHLIYKFVREHCCVIFFFILCFVSVIYWFLTLMLNHILFIPNYDY